MGYFVVGNPGADVLQARTFQELVAHAERELPASVLEQSPEPLLRAMGSGVARTVLTSLISVGEVKTMGQALRNAKLRADVRWLGGGQAERALLDAMKVAVSDLSLGLGPARAASGDTPAAPQVRASGLHAHMSGEALKRWAEEHHLQDWLKLSAEQLHGLLPSEAAGDLGWVPWSANVATMLAMPDLAPKKRGRTPGITPALREALLDLLDRAALMMARALEEETPRVSPADPAHAPLWEHLINVRKKARASTWPLPRELRSTWSLRVTPDPPAAVVGTLGFAVCSGRTSPSVTVGLTPGELPRDLTCDCSASKGACPRKLAVVDRLLDLLEDPAQAKIAAPLAEASSSPRWLRALRQLDPLLEPGLIADKEGAVELVGWRLRTSRGDPTLEPVSCRPKKTGRGFKFTRLDPLALRARPDLLAHPADLAALETLIPIAPQGTSWQPVERRPALRALGQLVGHPRVFLEDQSEPWAVTTAEVSLSWEGTAGGGVRIVPRVDGVAFAAEELLSALSMAGQGEHFVSLDPDRRRLRVVRLPARGVPLLKLLQERGIDYPAEARPELLRRLPAMSRMLHCSMGADLRGASVAPDLHPQVMLEVLPGEALSVQVSLRPLAEGPLLVPGEGPDELYAARPEGPVFCLRDREGEPAQVRAALASVPLPEEREQRPFTWVLEGPDQALPVLEALEALGDAAQVSWRGDLRRRVRSVSPGALKVQVSMKRDWLGLHGAASVGDLELELDALLRAVRSGSRYVAVDRETWVRISEPFREALSPLAVASHEVRGGAELSGLLAPLLDALEHEGAQVTGGEAWRTWADRLSAAATLSPALPEGLKAELRDYQREGYTWLARLAHWSPGACLADDMGLGKTLQALALLLARAAGGPALIVTPTSVSFNWLREAERFTPSLKLLLYRGGDRQTLLEKLGPGVGLVTSYDVLVRDVDALAGVHFHTLVLDEAQSFKNAATRRAQAVCRLDADFRLLLTGTPVENRTSELWSLFRAISPALLGSWEQFRDRFAGPIERGDDPGRRRALARLIRPFVLRRHKSEVARELPPRTEIQVDVDLSREERLVYERARREALAELEDGGGLTQAQRRVQILAALTRLRQAACHPRLVDVESRASSAKLERLRELVEQLRGEGNRALIFSQFVRLLTLAKEALVADGVSTRWLDGSTPERQRREEVDAFQRGEADVFLLSLKAGGTGLNLTAATYVIHLDPWWNPAVEDQATDRAHRIGQDQPVTVYRLVARGTLEEAILGLHADKRALAAEILDGTGSTQALSTDELMALLSGQDLGPEDPPSEEEPAPAPPEAAPEPAPAPAPEAPVETLDLSQLLAMVEDLRALIFDQIELEELSVGVGDRQLQVLLDLEQWAQTSRRQRFAVGADIPWWSDLEQHLKLQSGSRWNRMRPAARAVRAKVQAWCEAVGVE